MAAERAALKAKEAALAEAQQYAMQRDEDIENLRALRGQLASRMKAVSTPPVARSHHCACLRSLIHA